jgi:hypothetical protein
MSDANDIARNCCFKQTTHVECNAKVAHSDTRPVSTETVTNQFDVVDNKSRHHKTRINVGGRGTHIVCLQRVITLFDKMLSSKQLATQQQKAGRRKASYLSKKALRKQAERKGLDVPVKLTPQEKRLQEQKLIASQLPTNRIAAELEAEEDGSDDNDFDVDDVDVDVEGELDEDNADGYVAQVLREKHEVVQLMFSVVVC